ncbi:MAG: acetoacetate decarboxylase family protein [Myxococcota bacterium]|jgi:hypothetical protein
MLIGTGDPEERADRAPTVDSLDTDSLTLPEVSVLQVICEIDTVGMCEMLPPALHPTLPPAVSWLVYDCPETPWGPMRLAQTRIECRSGTRPRGLLSHAICNNEPAALALGQRWAYSVGAGEIDFRRSYDEVQCRVHLEDETVLQIGMRNPQVLAAGYIQFVAGMHPAHTPKGYRLLQCDPTHAETESEYGSPIVEEFEPDVWGDGRIDPVYPVSAAFCKAEITLPKLRFMCRPGEMAFLGTERV